MCSSDLKEECEAYCNDLAHMEECVDFAEKMGFMTPEDADRARRMAERGINVMQGGPGGCKGKEECEAFCQDPANMETCIDFAVQIGDMTPEEAEQAKKGMEAMQRGGPGGCKSEEECKAYCDDPAHQEECFNFAVEQGIIPPEEAQRMREMMERPSPMPPEGQIPPEGVMPPPTEIPAGPGGCQSEQECIQYCSQPEHFQECQKFAPTPQAPMPPPETITPSPGEMPPGEMLPPPEELPPQSLLKRINDFLASLISALGF